MSRLVILGAGIAGHTAALHACNKLKDHELMVISPNSRWNWIPSNIWVGIGMMEQKQVLFLLEPVNKKKGIVFKQAKAISIHPEGDSAIAKPFVTVEYTSDDKNGTTEKVEYDFLMNQRVPD
jgi:sulfide:quinone oxidoreductase